MARTGQWPLNEKIIPCNLCGQHILCRPLRPGSRQPEQDGAWMEQATMALITLMPCHVMWWLLRDSSAPGGMQPPSSRLDRQGKSWRVRLVLLSCELSKTGLCTQAWASVGALASPSHVHFLMTNWSPCYPSHIRPSVWVHALQTQLTSRKISLFSTLLNTLFLKSA